MEYHDNHQSLLLPRSHSTAARRHGRWPAAASEAWTWYEEKGVLCQGEAQPTCTALTLRVVQSYAATPSTCVKQLRQATSHTSLIWKEEKSRVCWRHPRPMLTGIESKKRKAQPHLSSWSRTPAHTARPPANAPVFFPPQHEPIQAFTLTHIRRPPHLGHAPQRPPHAHQPPAVGGRRRQQQLKVRGLVGRGGRLGQGIRARAQPRVR